MTTEPRYEVKETIVAGDWDELRRAHDREIQREVAMKRLRSASPPDDLHRRFLAEARITGLLEHPNILPVHDVGIDAEGRTFFTMKLVKGRTLDERIDVAERVRASHVDIDEFRISERLEIFAKVCDAIRYAHSRGIVHLDIGPDNIMIGDYGEVYVLDWDSARLLDERKAGLEAAEVPAGAPPPRSPEVARGEAVVDQRADIYALGCLLYELLAFASPWQADGRDLTRLVAGGEFPPPSIRAASRPGRRLWIPPVLEAMVLTAMRVDPAERYPDVETLRADVERFLDGQPTWASSNASVPVVVHRARRARRMRLGLLLAASLAGLGLGAWAGRGDPGAESAARRQEAESAYRDAIGLLDEARNADDRIVDDQEWLTNRLRPTLGLRRAIVLHPDPPAEWRARLEIEQAALRARAAAAGDRSIAVLLDRTIDE